MFRRFAALATSSLVVFSLGCSDDEPTTTTSGPATGGGGATTTAAGGNGSGGSGDGGSGGASMATCGPDITFTSHFGCDVDNLTDATDQNEITIGYGFSEGAFVYEPKCLHVCAGATVTFEPLDGTDFDIHPLQGGEPPGDDNSPFGFVAGSENVNVSFTLTEAGSFPYYCVAHLGSGMTGVVYVQ